jgi:hypothetical protein
MTGNVPTTGQPASDEAPFSSEFPAFVLPVTHLLPAHRSNARRCQSAADPGVGAAAVVERGAPLRSSVLQTPERSSGFHLPVHVGVMAGLSVPRPIDGEIYVRALGFFQAGFSYSDFPAFVADPLLSAAGIERIDDRGDTAANNMGCLVGDSGWYNNLCRQSCVRATRLEYA